MSIIIPLIFFWIVGAIATATLHISIGSPVDKTIAYGVFWPLWLLRTIIRGSWKILMED